MATVDKGNSKGTRKRTPEKSAPAKAKAASAARKRTPAGKSRKRVSMTLEGRHQMIAEEAYLRAERDGFSGDPVSHWLAAEQEIDQRLLEQHGSH